MKNEITINVLNYQDFNKIIELIPQEKINISKNIISELIFMSNTLKTLKEFIQKNGLLENTTDKYGNDGVRESGAIKCYNNTITRYNILFKQLIKMLPSNINVVDELDEFIES